MNDHSAKRLLKKLEDGHFKTILEPIRQHHSIKVCVASVSVGFPRKFRCFGHAKIEATTIFFFLRSPYSRAAEKRVRSLPAGNAYYAGYFIKTTMLCQSVSLFWNNFIHVPNLVGTLRNNIVFSKVVKFA